MERDSFVFYKSFYEGVRNLPVKIKIEVLISIFEFALYGNEYKCKNAVSESIFQLIKPQIVANNNRYEKGCKGGAPKGNNNNSKGVNQYSKNRTTEDNQELNKEDNLRTTEDNIVNQNCPICLTEGQPNENENVNVNDNIKIDISFSNEKSISTKKSSCPNFEFDKEDNPITAPETETPNPLPPSHIPQSEESAENSVKGKSKKGKTAQGNFDFKQALLDIGVSEQTADDWLSVRKANGGKDTLTSFKMLKTQIDKSGVSAEECIAIATYKNWRGFEGQWIANEKARQMASAPYAHFQRANPNRQSTTRFYNDSIPDEEYDDKV